MGNFLHSVVESDHKVVKALYEDEFRLNEMARFHDNVKRSGPTPFECVIRIIKSKAVPTSILDAGCGVGTLWELVREMEHIQTLLLLDQSPNLVNRACEKVRKFGIKDVRGVIADLNDTPLLIDGKVDIILSLQVYQHLNQVESAHNYLRGLLNNDGIIVATTCNQAHMCELYEQVALFFDVDYEEARGLKHFNEMHLMRLLGVTESKDVIGKIQCDSADMFLAYVSSLAILDRFDLKGTSIGTEFMSYMKRWAEEKISDTGSIELNQSVKLAVFEP